MFSKTLVGIILLGSLGLFGTAIAQTDVSGTWMLNGPGTESEILLTEEGKRLQSDYNLLADDPSLYCTPASSSRIWANPGAPIKIEQTGASILISYELFDLRREIPLGDESALTDQPSTRNSEGDTLHITHTYIDESIFEKPLVLEYFFRRADETELNVYDCTEANYNWFDELNAN